MGKNIESSKPSKSKSLPDFPTPLNHKLLVVHLGVQQQVNESVQMRLKRLEDIVNEMGNVIYNEDEDDDDSSGGNVFKLSDRFKL